jgi:hypothetical protein
MEHAWDGDLAGLGQRMVRAYLGAWEDPELSPSLRALFRSRVSNEHAATQMREFLQARILATAALRRDVDQGPRRAAWAAAQLLAVAITRYIMHMSPLADTDILAALFAPAIQAILAPTGTGQSPHLRPARRGRGGLIPHQVHASHARLHWPASTSSVQRLRSCLHERTPWRNAGAVGAVARMSWFPLRVLLGGGRWSRAPAVRWEPGAAGRAGRGE